MTFRFVSNNAADFNGGAYQTARANSYRTSRVSGAIEMTGDNDDPITYAEHSFAAVAGDVTWIHAQVALQASNIFPGHGDSDGDLYCEAYDANADKLFQLDVVNGSTRLLVFGDTTGSQTFTNDIHAGDLTRKAIDIKVDLSGGNLHVQVFRNATDGTAVPVWDVSVANTGAKGNPTRVRWRSSGTHFNSNSIFQQISEVMVGDEDTRGLGLTDLFSYGAGTHTAWGGDPAGLSDNDQETGVSTGSAGAKVSRTVSGYTGPTGVTVRGVFLPAHGKLVSILGDVRAFLRNTTSGTQYDAAAAYGFDETLKAGDLVEFANNPETAAQWNDSEFTDFEIGLEALAP